MDERDTKGLNAEPGHQPGGGVEAPAEGDADAGAADAGKRKRVLETTKPRLRVQ